MKKSTKILSIVLSFVMVMLLCCSCGKATPEERLQAAFDTANSAKKFDIDYTFGISVTVEGETMEIPMTIGMQVDNTDEANPVMAMDMTMTMLGMQIPMNYYYKDGYAYTSVMGQKVKTAMSYEDMMAENGTGVEDMLALTKEALDKAEITENEDGSLSVKMALNGADYKDALLAIVGEDMFDTFGAEAFAFTDCSVEIAVGTDDNIEKMSMTIGMTMTIEGVEATASCEAEVVYNAIGGDFTVELPTDLDTYTETAE